jgi:hypothetical protein
MDYDYLNVRELKTVCKFFKVDVPPRATRAHLESLIVLVQTQIAMRTIEGYNYYLEHGDVEVPEEDEEFEEEEEHEDSSGDLVPLGG